MVRTTTTMFALAFMLSAASAAAAPKRTPLWSSQQERETELTLERWETPAVLERTRSFGRKYAVFHAEPQEIAPEAILVFQVESQGEVRWRCVAVDDVAECLGSPVRIPYQAQEETVRMTVKAVPRETPRGEKLVHEAKKTRDQRMFAGGSRR